MRREAGARRPPTSWSPAMDAGTTPGWPRDRRRVRNRAAAAERGRPFAVPADRRVRVSLQLPYRRARGAGRRDRLALRAALRLTERLRQPARPRGRLLPLRTVRDQPPDRRRLSAGDERARDDVEDAERLDRRPRRADNEPAR